MRRQALLLKEEHLLQVYFESNFELILEGVVPASPRFIADFRLETHPEVQAEQEDLLSSKCGICFEDFVIGESYARWPCKGQHPFHYGCMLQALRNANTCPLCRTPVEAVSKLHLDMLYQQMVGQSLFRFAV